MRSSYMNLLCKNDTNIIRYEIACKSDPHYLFCKRYFPLIFESKNHSKGPTELEKPTVFCSISTKIDLLLSKFFSERTRSFLATITNNFDCLPSKSFSRRAKHLVATILVKFTQIDWLSAIEVFIKACQRLLLVNNLLVAYYECHFET